MRCGLVIISLMLGASVALAQDDLSVYPPERLQPFLGLDDTSATTRVQPGRARSLQNVTIGLSADLRKRAGLDMIGSSLDVGGEDFCTVTGLTYAQFSGSTARTVAICGPRISYLSGTTWVQSAYLGFTGGQNDQFVFAPALSTLIATNDAQSPRQWDGSASTAWLPVSFTGLTNAIQSARTVAFYQNYLIFGNTVEAGTRFPTRIRWSNVGTINTWTTTDVNDVDAPAGQELNCLGQLYGDLYLGFTSSLYKMSLVGGSGTFAFTRISNEVGCAAKNSMQQLALANAQTGLIFLDNKKRVYFFNGISLVEVSQLIHGTLDAARGNRLQYAVSAVDSEHYYLCLSGSGASTNNLCVDYNYLIGEWSKHVYPGLTGINAMAKVIDSNNLSQIYVGTGDSFVYQMTGTSLDNDVGSAGGVVDAVNRIAQSTASSLLVLYDNTAAFTASALVGAPIELTGGTASGAIGVVTNNTATGLIVARDFSTTPDSTTAYQVGRINAYYTTRWDDFGASSHIKEGLELFLVADADLGSTLDIGYATNFQSNTATPTVDLTPSVGSIWGTGVWGTAVWGGGDTIFVGSDDGPRVKLEDSGRWWSFTFTEDDRDENFRAHGWQVLYRKGRQF